MARDHRGIFLLAAEPAACLGLHDTNLVVRKAQEHPQRAVNVVGALERAVHGDSAVLRHRDDAVRFDVELLLEADAIFPLDDDVRLRETAREVSLFDPDLLEAVVGFLRVVDRRVLAVVDGDARLGLEETLAVLVG